MIQVLTLCIRRILEGAAKSGVISSYKSYQMGESTMFPETMLTLKHIEAERTFAQRKGEYLIGKDIQPSLLGETCMGSERVQHLPAWCRSWCRL